MSFYNVTNPSNYNTVSDGRFMLTQQNKLVRTAGVQSLNVTASYTDSGIPGPIAPEILIGGNLFVQPNGASRNIVLPLAADLATLLMGPGGFDISSGDIFTFRVFNLNAGANDVVVKVNASSGQTNTGSDITISPVAAGSPRAYANINLKFTITSTTAGTTYSYAMF